MSLELNLPPALEDALRKRAATVGLDISAYVVQTLELLEAEQTDVAPQSSEQFHKKLQALVDLHANAPGSFDDSRDALYGDGHE